MTVYKAECINTNLYWSEVWAIYLCHLKTLEKFHQYCRRKVLCMRWEDRHTNASILMKDNITAIEAMVMQNQLRWAPVCEHMVCRETIQRHDTNKDCMKTCQIDINTCEPMAADRLLNETEKRQRKGRCLNIFTSPFNLASPVHTATRSAHQESGS